MKNAFFILSYIKKLCLHPQLLTASSTDKKYNLGLLSPEEAAVIQAQLEADQEQRATSRMCTRRANKGENLKRK